MTHPKLKLVSVTAAVTYRFEPEGREFGWALCTVNDATGELSIQSDWGNSAYRWDARPSNLAAPTLTHFIARSGREYEYDYLARKLLGGRSGTHEWDRDATVAHHRRVLAERRLEVGQRPADGGRRMVLTRDFARELWDRLGEIAEHADEREYIEAFTADDDLCRWIDDTPYESTQHKPTGAYRILTESILPALVEACVARVQSIATQPDNTEVARG